jgi:hypothetical protein
MIPTTRERSDERPDRRHPLGTLQTAIGLVRLSQFRIGPPPVELDLGRLIDDEVEPEIKALAIRMSAATGRLGSAPPRLLEAFQGTDPGSV